MAAIYVSTGKPGEPMADGDIVMATDEKQKATGYDRFKRHEEKEYSGMRVGRAHKWYYDQGEWRERKLSPDDWEIYYQTTKRRAARAPEESGAPIGTEYNWLIVSHQRVDKLDANSYMTCMEGRKFKVAHKRASKNAWSASEKAQRKKVIQYLEQMIEELKRADESESLPYSVGEHDHIYGLNLRTKNELLEMAKAYSVPVKSSMKREELLEAVREGLDRREKAKGDGQAKPKPEGAGAKPDGVEAKLQQKSKGDLYKLASEHNISGRSHMNKMELMHALASEIRSSGANARL